MRLDVRPVTLTGDHVVLRPLTLDDVPALAAVGLDPELWRWVTTSVASAADMRAYVETALAEQARGVALPFATVDRNSGRVVGSTRYASIDAVHRRVEIGWTWITPTFQRTAVNTEAKLLMLAHAFETLGCLRVELKTDVLNARSRAAIQRLGCKEEGIFRKHMVCASGRIRDTVYYSMIDEEWPAAKERLRAKLRA